MTESVMAVGTPPAGERPSILGKGVACPRCTFDLRGVIGAWRDQCPLDGCCPECGLDVHWGELYRPRCYEPAWAMEFAPGPFRVLLRTSVRTLRPGGFWRWIRLAYPVRRGRLLFYLAVLCVVVWIAAGLPTGLICGLAANGRNGTPVEVLVAFVIGAFAPLTDQTQVVHAPQWMLTSPRDFFNAWAGPYTGWFTLALAMNVIAPLCLIALRESMTQAKVRAEHVYRISVYGGTSLALLAVVWSLPVLGVVGLRFLGAALFNEYPTEWMAVPGFLAWLLAFAWWWRCALRHYMKFPDVRLVIGVLGLLVFILSMVVVFAFDSEFATDLVPGWLLDVMPRE